MRLSRSKFEKWLKDKDAAEVVGFRRDNYGCPLARYHADASGGYEVVISSNEWNGIGYVIDRGYGNRQLPGWADGFAFLVDGEAATEITAGRALELLAQVAP